ncbi:hypothetical protein CEXT_469331 [Caerostris extrusa]|uniref:Uncharacterized protein n=1 Tax=Caerostris extrusa TaxID=172846 RepID=A0AAV4WSR9_CAEEX|nr:hypothetical protein CEXT_469331 [Caerostris extrusa]
MSRSVVHSSDNFSFPETCVQLRVNDDVSAVDGKHKPELMRNTMWHGNRPSIETGKALVVIFKPRKASSVLTSKENYSAAFQLISAGNRAHVFHPHIPSRSTH